MNDILVKVRILSESTRHKQGIEDDHFMKRTSYINKVILILKLSTASNHATSALNGERLVGNKAAFIDQKYSNIVKCYCRLK